MPRTLVSSNPMASDVTLTFWITEIFDEFVFVKFEVGQHAGSLDNRRNSRHRFALLQNFQSLLMKPNIIISKWLEVANKSWKTECLHAIFRRATNCKQQAPRMIKAKPFSTSPGTFNDFAHVAYYPFFRHNVFVRTDCKLYAFAYDCRRLKDHVCKATKCGYKRSFLGPLPFTLCARFLLGCCRLDDDDWREEEEKVAEINLGDGEPLSLLHPESPDGESRRE